MHDICTIPIAGIREPFCSLSHIVGASIFAAFALILVQRGRGNWARTVSLSVMAFASVQMLVLSSTYHMLWPGPMREIMLRADVAGIFLLIAGCITPVHVILFRGAARWAPLLLVWTLAVVGLVLRMIFFNHMPGFVGIAIFLVFGWGGAITATVLWWKYGWGFVCPAVMAGVAYTLGALALLLHYPVLIHGIVGPHELWHLAVLSGLGLHWRFVFKFATGRVPEDSVQSRMRRSLIATRKT